MAHCNDTPELLAELFGCYDRKNTGKVPLRVARNILQNCGEVLTNDEMNAVLAEVGASTDEIDYKAFCARLASIISPILGVSPSALEMVASAYPDIATLWVLAPAF